MNNSKKKDKHSKIVIEKWKGKIGGDTMEMQMERYCTVSESLEESLKQMKDMRNGKLPKKTWRQFRKELKEEDKNNE